MIINRIWTSVMILVYSHEGTLSLPKMSMPYSFCFCYTCNIRGLIVGIFIPSSISFTDIAINLFCDVPSPWPSHMLQHWMNLTEWAQSIFPSCGRTNLSWCIRLNILHWKPKWHLFSHRITEWRLMQLKLPLEVVIKHDLRIRLQHHLLLQHEHRDTIVLHNNVGYVHHGMYTMTLTLLSIDIFVTWSKNWSSVDQWASTDVY
jgi:hypothetical protein